MTTYGPSLDPRRSARGWLLIAALTWLAGCSTQAKWTYPLQGDRLFHSVSTAESLTVAVFPFQEERPVSNVSATRAVWLVPFAPFGWVTYERPDAARDFNSIEAYDFDVDDDLGRAAARSFEQSALFRRVYFTLGGETREADLILRGTARRTAYDGKIYSYGISVFANLLWWLGLPTGSSTNSLAIELRLYDQDDLSVWSYGFNQSEGVIQGLYYNAGDDMTNLASLMEEAMNGALQDLAGRLPELTARLKGLPASVPVVAPPSSSEPPPRPPEAP